MLRKTLLGKALSSFGLLSLTHMMTPPSDFPLHFAIQTGYQEVLGMRSCVDPTVRLYHSPPADIHPPPSPHTPSPHTPSPSPPHTPSPQISYFGLQYQTKSECLRWVDRQKPLRKQLEKYAVDGARNAELRFRVQYYVTTVTKLQHEITK